MGRGRREDLVKTALDLFERGGFHATGIDRILAEAGVAKKTLYHHFRSKEELIVAALRLRDERFRADFARRVGVRSGTPDEALLAIFDALGELAKQKKFCGCVFINACAEYADRESPIHVLAAEHKRLLQDYVRELTDAAGALDPEGLAKQLSILMDGVIVTAQVSSEPDAAERAREVAEMLIREQL